MVRIREEASAQAARIARIAASVIRRSRIQTKAETDLSLTQEWALALLVESAGMNGAELARAQNVRPQTMSTALAGLEKMHYIEKAPDLDDGRRTILRATGLGTTAMREAREAKHAWLASVIAEFTDTERGELSRGLDLLERVAEK